jgi:preprotein translocase subunit Sec61beta
LSRNKRRNDEAPMPASGAGLPAFLGERTNSQVKVRPELVVGLTVALIVAVIVANAIIGSI